MLGFIISKMNLLIMVTAIFALVAYFAFFFGKSVELRDANALLNNFSEDSYGVLSSTGQCHQVMVSVPPFIRSIGTGEIGNKLRFLVQVDKIINPSTNKTIISYSILRKKDKSIIASKPFATEASVHLYQWDEDTGNILLASDKIEINPVSAVCSDSAVGCLANPSGIGASADTILLVKEVYHGNANLHVIPCSSQAGWCSANYQKVVTIVESARGGSFNCETGA